MHDLRFFDEVDRYFQTTQAGLRLSRYLSLPQPAFPPNATTLKNEIYPRWLERLLKLLEVPQNVESRHRELKPLYHLIQQLDPYYFTEERILRDLSRCPTLLGSQQKILSQHIIAFLQVLRKLHQGQASPRAQTSVTLEDWLALFPLGKEWLALDWLAEIGAPFPAHEAGYRAWHRFTHGTVPSASSDHVRLWQKICANWAEAHRHSPIYTDGLATAWSGAWAFLDLPGFCGDSPHCSLCPLQPQCKWVNAAQALADDLYPVSAIQKRQTERLPTLDLLCWMWGLGAEERAQLSPYFHKPHSLRGFDAKAFYEISDLVPQVPYVGERFKALLEICKRYNEQRLEPGAELDSATAVFQHFRFRLRDLKQELFLVVFLNNQRHYLGEMTITMGLVTHTLVHPREIFSAAIEYRASSIICVHNHPSGKPYASAEDIATTRQLTQTGEIVGIPLLDHIIIGQDSYFSLAERGIL